MKTKGWKVQVQNMGTFKNVRAVKNGKVIVCNLSNFEPVSSFLRFKKSAFESGVQS